MDARPEGLFAERPLLLVEDDPADADLVLECLSDIGEDAPPVEVVGTLAGAIEALDGGERYLAVLLDLDLPDSEGLDTLDRMLDRTPSSPVIVLTGGGASSGVEAVARGAADFVPKDELTGRLLLRSVRYAAERRQRHGAEARYRALVENSRDLVSILDEDLSILYVSPSLERILGYRPEEKIGGPTGGEVHPDDLELVQMEMDRLLENASYSAHLHYRARHRNGEWRVLDSIAQNCFANPHIRGIVVNSRDVTDLREAERAASQTARELERTLEALDDAVFTVDAPRRVIDGCNPRAESMFGYASGEMVGESTRMLYGDESSFLKVHQEGIDVLERGEAYRAELQMRRREGELFPVELTVTLLDPEMGVEGGVVSVIRDITERVEQARQVRFQAALLQQVGQPVLAVDEEGRVTYWNAAAEELTGFAKEEVEGRKILDLIVREGDRESALMARQAARAGGRWEGELRLRSRGGGEVVVQATATPGVNPDGSPGGRIAAGVDVSELRRAEEESRRAAERLRFQAEMLEAVGQAVVATDMEGRITYWNGSAEELYGWSREEALGRRVTEVTPSEGGREQAEEILETLQEGRSWTGESELRRRDGSTFHALVTDAPMLDEEGRLTGIIGISSDISERKELEARLRQAEKMEAIGRLAGGVAHDFNNLLTAVEGHATLLIEELPEDSPLREHGEEILKAGHRAADLTRQLLAFSRKQVLKERTVDLGEVALELKVLLLRLVPESIDFRVEPCPEAVVVRADPGQLQQVVMNLVVNAVDAIEDGGSITVGIDAVDLDAREVEEIAWHVEPGRYARLSVRDTGIGMSEELVGHIFEPFFTTKPEGRGTGLGLATVYGIVKQSAGHLFVDSTPGRGTLFQVLLPRLEEEPERAPETARSMAEGGEGVVLLVEDDDAVRSVTRRVLVRSGYTVLEATNGREAIEVADRHDGTIHLVISDVVMPEVGGIELQKRMQVLYPEVRFILASGYSEAEVHSEIKDMGTAFLSKPFTPTTLLRAVAESLSDPA